MFKTSIRNKAQHVRENSYASHSHSRKPSTAEEMVRNQVPSPIRQDPAALLQSAGRKQPKKSEQIKSNEKPPSVPIKQESENSSSDWVMRSKKDDETEESDFYNNEGTSPDALRPKKKETSEDSENWFKGIKEMKTEVFDEDKPELTPSTKEEERMRRIENIRKKNQRYKKTAKQNAEEANTSFSNTYGDSPSKGGLNSSGYESFTGYQDNTPTTQK